MKELISILLIIFIPIIITPLTLLLVKVASNIVKSPEGELVATVIIIIFVLVSSILSVDLIDMIL